VAPDRDALASASVPVEAGVVVLGQKRDQWDGSTMATNLGSRNEVRRPMAFLETLIDHAIARALSAIDLLDQLLLGETEATLY
jgi:hypothetical protein